ncbi:GPN-loop GTPase 3 isoform X1 [Bacillus rossius redtenbacheri]|uniref:GPN-loop GTPase 3 isoform X1 n=1 Tax=Bacillus rossius redtenbacheri TaxID=93214 RepID=UPI002FDC85FB
MRYAQLVLGPAGSGKSTYCATLQKHAADDKRTIDVVNLDPAAEYFDYQPLVDIRELIHIDDAMEDEDLRFGPNGGLIFCMDDGEVGSDLQVPAGELGVAGGAAGRSSAMVRVRWEVTCRYLLENPEWLEEQLGEGDDDYLLFDCPGQIELYTHMTTVRQLVELLQRWNFQACVVFLLDAQFMIDGAKFLSGTMAALSVMVNVELPHVNVLSKMDLLSKTARNQLDRLHILRAVITSVKSYLEPDPHSLLGEMETKSKWGVKYRRLTEAIGRIIEDYSLVRFYPLNVRDEENIADLLLTIDNVIQFGEDSDVKTRDFDYPDDDDEGGDT